MLLAMGLEIMQTIQFSISTCKQDVSFIWMTALLEYLHIFSSVIVLHILDMDDYLWVDGQILQMPMNWTAYHEVVTTPNLPPKAMPYASKVNDDVPVAKKMGQCSSKMANSLLYPFKYTSLI